MKHWKTREDIGNGYQYNEKEHKEFTYNSLLEVTSYEKSTMRTNYLVRDIWSDGQLLELRDFINSTLDSRSK